MISLRAMLLVVGAPLISATSNYEDRCKMDTDPMQNFSAALPAPITRGPSSYDNNMLYFRSNDNGVCTPFRVLSDWDDTLKNSGDSTMGRIAGGDTSVCEKCQYPNFGQVFNLVTCSWSTEDHLLPYDRYLTLLTARPDTPTSNLFADGSKKHWSKETVALMQDAANVRERDAHASVPENKPKWISPNKVENCGWWGWAWLFRWLGRCSVYEETRARISVLPGSGRDAILNADSIMNANKQLNAAAVSYDNYYARVKQPLLEMGMEGLLNIGMEGLLKPRVEMQLVSMERQYYLNGIGNKKVERFRAYSAKFPEAAGSFVFFGDDGQADMTVAAPQLLAEQAQDGTYQLAFVAIHATTPKARLGALTDRKKDFPYSEVSREMMHRTMNRRFPPLPLAEFGHKPRFFYFTDYFDLENQLVEAGWVHGSNKNPPNEKSVYQKDMEIFLDELIEVRGPRSSLAYIEIEDQIQESLEELHDMPTAGFSSHQSFFSKNAGFRFNTNLKKPLTKLAQLSRKAYCAANQPKQTYEKSLLAEHIVQELMVYGADWDYCGPAEEDCRPALNLKEFCAISSRQELSKKYPRVDTSSGFVFPGDSR